MENLGEKLLSALSGAEDAVSRLDERLRACAFADGWAGRQDFSEAAAWSWNASFGVSLEDLILHDEGMDTRMPDDALRATHGLVRARRKVRAAGAAVLSPDGAAWLAGRRPGAPPPSPPPPPVGLDPDAPLVPQLVKELEVLRGGVTEGAQAAVREWLRLLHLSDDRLRPLLQAAVALEGWRIVEPYPREGFVGPLLVAAWLTSRRRVRSGLLGMEAGYREVVRRSRPSAALLLGDRILFWLGVIRVSADAGGEALNRLELARQVAMARVGARRAHSRLAALIALMLERPVVTAPLVAEKLKLTSQSARRLLGELGGSVTEISGQVRYRAWRLG